MTLRILIADDEHAARHGMTRALSANGREITEAADGRAALERIRSERPDLVFLDLTMPELDGLGVLRELQAHRLTCEIIVVTANDNVRTAVECVRLGAADYITKPFEVEQLRAIARRIEHRLELEQRVDSLQVQLDEQSAFGALVGVSPAMRELYRQIERVAPSSLDVLIRGETGTGKELIAREIHRRSPRAAGPFIPVNTAAIAASLIESELFGHVRGAFTGAEANRQGVFEQAHGGTLFLDEIGDMPLAAQAKILRALQERTVQPVGGSKPAAVDVRVISATHQDLSQAIAEKHFRQDLYYRIRGVELVVPSLRSRREDILVLARYFLERAVQGGTTPRLAAGAVERLLTHSWPGNVRELEHAIAAAATMAPEGEIRAVDLGLPATKAPAPDLDLSQLRDLPLTEAKDQLLEQFERLAILSALDKHAGNLSAAARQLGVHRQSLQQKMDRLGIPRPSGGGSASAT